MAGSKKPPDIRKMLFNSSAPIEQRKHMLGVLCMDESEGSTKTVEAILEAAASSDGESQYAEKIKEVDALIAEMNDGPVRYATFLRLLEPKGSVLKASVVLEDGASASVTVPDAAFAASLRCGDTILLDAQGRAVLGADSHGTDSGEEARLERRLNRGRVEVSIRDHERCVFRASADLLAKLDAGEVSTGDTLVVCSRRRFAFDALPKEDGPAHYRHLARCGVPDVLVARDVGAPPALIEELSERVRLAMTAPDAAQRYRLQSCVTRLLAGVSGSGKTLAIHAFWRRMYEVIADVTGAPIESLPQRVVILRSAQVLSKWFGESDKNLDRFFDETERLAAEPFVAPDGRVHALPVLAIMEEIDSLARARGEDAIYDRVMTTALTRLEASSSGLRDKLVLFLATTNVPHLVDTAFLRRIGGKMERFGRLGRRDFVAVLQKHVDRLPFAVHNGDGPSGTRRRAVADVTAWLYSVNGSDRGQVELTFAASATTVTKFRRDFLTGSVVDRAVQAAAWEACRAEHSGFAPAGLTTELLVEALDQQIGAIVGQLDPANVHNYIDLPDGARIASVRRVPQPSILPFQLERASSGGAP